MYTLCIDNLSGKLTADSAWYHWHLPCLPAYTALSCTPLSGNNRGHSSLLTKCFMKCLAGPDNGKTKLDHEYSQGMYALLLCHAARNQSASQHTMSERKRRLCALLLHFRAPRVNAQKKVKQHVRALGGGGVKCINPDPRAPLWKCFGSTAKKTLTRISAAAVPRVQPCTCL